MHFGRDGPRDARADFRPEKQYASLPRPDHPSHRGVRIHSHGSIYSRPQIPTSKLSSGVLSVMIWKLPCLWLLVPGLDHTPPARRIEQWRSRPASRSPELSQHGSRDTMGFVTKFSLFRDAVPASLIHCRDDVTNYSSRSRRWRHERHGGHAPTDNRGQRKKD
jgi:hypothetical protein